MLFRLVPSPGTRIENFESGWVNLAHLESELMATGSEEPSKSGPVLANEGERLSLVSPDFLVL